MPLFDNRIELINRFEFRDPERLAHSDEEWQSCTLRLWRVDDYETFTVLTTFHYLTWHVDYETDGRDVAKWQGYDIDALWLGARVHGIPATDPRAVSKNFNAAMAMYLALL